ncbi:MAG: polyprenyl synthetase family protein [Oscillospiraceae bacterium]
MSADFNKTLEKDVEIIENTLKKYIDNSDIDYKNVCDAMKYSVENGGKRLRPVLTLEFCKACNGDVSVALPFACAIEMVHTYSLIHDDLPCMDNDDMRRGRPSCHIRFGEEYALLAGDALLTLAFETASSGSADANIKIKAVNELAKRSGINGMIGGQVMDILNENKVISLETVKKTELLKTSALIECATVMGCIAANASDKKINAARAYAQNIGIAFQIMDDILDVTGDSEKLGKPVGRDAENQKSTFVSLLGLDVSKELVAKFTKDAKDCLKIFEEESTILAQFADSLCDRDR